MSEHEPPGGALPPPAPAECAALGRLEDLPADYVASLRERHLVPLWPSLRALLPPDLPARRTRVVHWAYTQIRPLLLRAGAVPEPVWRLRARTLQSLPKRVGRTEVLRGIAERDPEGGLQVRTTGAQGSGILSSFASANVLIVLDEARGAVAEGDEVDVWPLDGLI